MIEKIKQYEDLVERLEKYAAMKRLQLEKLGTDTAELLKATPWDNVPAVLRNAKDRSDRLTSDLNSIYLELNYTQAFLKDLKGE